MRRKIQKAIAIVHEMARVYFQSINADTFTGGYFAYRSREIESNGMEWNAYAIHIDTNVERKY